MRLGVLMPLTDKQEADAFLRSRGKMTQYRKPHELEEEVRFYLEQHPRHKLLSVTERVKLKNRILKIVRSERAVEAWKTRRKNKEKKANEKLRRSQLTFGF